MKKTIYTVSILLFGMCLMLSCIKTKQDPIAVSDVKDVTTVPSTQNDSAFSITLSNSISVADSAELTKIVISLTKPDPTKNHIASLSIQPIGKFTNGLNTFSATLDVNGQASAYMFSDKIGVATLSVRLGQGPIKNTAITYTNALPDQLEIEPGASQLKPDSGANVKVTVKATRQIGRVSPGIKITFEDSTANGKSVGIFMNKTVTNISGKASATYLLQDTTVRGYLYLKASAQGTNSIMTARSRVFIR
jgi:hypothetical protein